MNPMAGPLDVRYGPRNVTGQHLVVRIVRVAVREVHGNFQLVRRHVERRLHAPVDLDFFGTRVILDHVPRAFDLKFQKHCLFTTQKLGTRFTLKRIIRHN